MNFKPFLLSLTALSASFATVAQSRWTLQDCISYALENNIQIQQSNLTAESSEVTVKQSQAAFFPTLTFSTSQQFGFQKVETQDVSTYDATAKNPTYTGSYGLNLNVTLYDGLSNVNTLKQSRIQHESDIYSAQKTSNNVQLQIIQNYYQILYAHESVLTNEEIVRVAERELERTKAKLEVGKGSKVDVAQMESQYQQNQYSLVNARNQEAAYILTLKQLLQLGTGDDFAIDYQSFSTDDVMALLPTVDEAQQMTLANLPDMKAAQLDVQSAELATKIAKAGYQPTLSLSASVATSNGNTYNNNFAEQVKDHMHESVGLTLSVPIWDGRRTRSSVDKSKIQLSAAQLAQEDTRLDICNTIASLHLDITSAQARYASAVKSEASAKESFELMEQRFDVGLESVVDLLSEKNKYLQARQETLQSKYTALLNIETMKFYTKMEGL